MANEPVTVVGYDDDKLYIRATSRSACIGCSLKNGCGQQLLASLRGNGEGVLALPLNQHKHMADPEMESIMLELPDGTVTRLALFLYGIPLLSVLLGTFLADVLVQPGHELIVVLAALVSLLAGLLGVKSMAPRHEVRVLDQLQQPFLRSNR